MTRFPPETAEVGDLVHIEGMRGAFRIMRFADEDHGGASTTPVVHCFGPIPGKSGNLKKAGGSRVFYRDKITKIQEKGGTE